MSRYSEIDNLRARVAELEQENAELKLRPRKASIDVSSDPVAPDLFSIFHRYEPSADKHIKIEVVGPDGERWLVETKLDREAGKITRFDALGVTPPS